MDNKITHCLTIRSFTNPDPLVPAVSVSKQGRDIILIIFSQTFNSFEHLHLRLVAI